MTELLTSPNNERAYKMDHDDTNSRVFIVMLNDADLVYSSETGTISSVFAGSTQTQTQDSSKL